LDDDGKITEEDDELNNSVSEENGSHRLLLEIMKDSKTKSNFCKTKCIDKGKVFCPSDNYKGGICCDSKETCTPGRSTDRNFYQTTAWCSDYNPPDTPDIFKWFVCPNEATCGDDGKKYIIPPLNGETITRAIDKDNNLFLDNDICAWVVKNPDLMGARDWMWIEITKVDRCGVFVSKAYNYKYKSRNKPKKVSNVKLGMLRGLDYYVISHAVSQFPAYFRLKTWIERHNPPSEPKPKVDPTPTPSKPKIDDPTDKDYDHAAEKKKEEEKKKKEEEEKQRKELEAKKKKEEEEKKKQEEEKK